jgi:hypothetical protein
MSAGPSGDEFVSADFQSAARMELKSNTIVPHTRVPQLQHVWPGKLIFVTTTGGGLSANTGYFRGTNNEWLSVAGGKHKHDADDAVAGGSFADIAIANMTKTITWDLHALGDYMSVGTGTHAEEPENADGGRVKITASASGQYRHLFRGGMGLDFGKPSSFMFKGYNTHGTQLGAKIGVNMENVNATHNDNRKYGVEACDSAGTAKNWDVVSATGALNSRSVVTSTELAAKAAPRAYRLVHTVAQDVRFFVNGVQNQIKTSNVPASGASSSIGNISIGIKSNDATSKSIYVYGVRLSGSVNDTTFV